MGTGSTCGTRRPRSWGLSLFLSDEGGYTTVAFAVAMLVSLTLVFSAATAEWATTREADVQSVADACALAGENVVGAYATIATTLDACVLSMGLLGILVFGVGLVVSAIPGLASVGARVVAVARQVLDARVRFATSACEGLRRLESGLPFLIVANSGRCVSENATAGSSLVGVALPFPQESQSDWSSLPGEVDDEGLTQSASELQEQSDKAKEAADAADEALLAGWMADCGSEPRCLQERAGSLAGLAGTDNPDYPSTQGWNFGVPLMRARAYYAARLRAEAPTEPGIEGLTDSCARRTFFSFALERVREGHYQEAPDGTIDLDLPSLPHDADEVRGTTLYTDATWPCSEEAAGRTLHSSAECPGATGPLSGVASLAQLDAGGVARCPTCGMDVDDMGKVAAASTSIDNGFEHHWRRVVEASRDYQAARNEQVRVEGEMRQTADVAAEAFDRALAELSVPRPRLCPAGAWGCVAVVARGEGTTAPAELTDAFLSSAELPAGAAVSAATLAPDPGTDGGNVLSRLFDGMVEGVEGEGIPGALSGITEVWGELLVGYGSAYDDVGQVADGLFSGIDGLSGTGVGAWLKGRLVSCIEALGFQPTDLRLRKPVLCNTQDVLDKGGSPGFATIRRLVESVPADGDPSEVAAALGRWVVDEYGDTKVVVAELPIPGTDCTIPLSIDLSTLAGAA
jgi:hypothetical protein